MAATSNTSYVRLFRARRDYCAALAQLSRGQLELIESDDYTQLLVVLGRKQGLLGRMEELRLGQPDLWREWKQDREQLDAESRQTCENLLAETEGILRELHQHEQVSTETLTRRRDQTRSRLESVSGGLRAHEAYGADQSGPTHRRLDIGQ
jgi:hypothetical protein